MSLQVSVTFPGQMNIGEFASHLNTLKKLGCTFQIGESVVPIPASKSVAGRQFNQAMTKGKKESHVELTEELSADEEKVLDQVMARTHSEGTSPLLDELTRNKVGKLKPNMSREIMDYYRANPGHTTKQGAGFLAEKFVAHYSDVNDAFKRIQNLINTICHSKTSQKTLEKRGGKRGWGGQPAQVFVIEGR